MVPMMTTEHLLALFLFIGIPLRDMFETRALKTSTDPHHQILTYRRIAVVEWTAALVAWMPCDLGFSCSGPAPVTPLAGVYCELREQACKQIFVRELEALRGITHVGYYEAMAARPRVLTKACWARDCCEST